jgi:hypothetical protein
MMMEDEKVTKLIPKYMTDAREVLAGLTSYQVRDVAMYFTNQFIEEVEKGLKGELDYEDAPFFEVIDRMYAEAQPTGCYFCDRSIDANETPFDYPEKTRICLSCQLKVANLLKAFGIDHRGLFPGMGARKIQAIIYEVIPMVVRGENNVVH